MIRKLDWGTVWFYGCPHPHRKDVRVRFWFESKNHVLGGHPDPFVLSALPFAGATDSMLSLLTRNGSDPVRRRFELGGRWGDRNRLCVLKAYGRYLILRHGYDAVITRYCADNLTDFLEPLTFMHSVCLDALSGPRLRR